MEFNNNLYERLKRDICDNKDRCVRYKPEQKELFRKYIKDLADEYGISYDIETYSNEENINVVLGDINNANVILCAHYDTAHIYHYKAFYEGVKNLNSPKNLNFIELKNIAKQTINPRPSLNNYNDNSSGIILSLLFAIDKKIPIILFDNEEDSFKGSKCFSSTYKCDENPLFINLDCVGRGEHLVFKSYKLSNDEIYTWIITLKEFMPKTSILNFKIVQTDIVNLKAFKSINISRSDWSHFMPHAKYTHSDFDDTINDDYIIYLYYCINKML